MHKCQLTKIVSSTRTPLKGICIHLFLPFRRRRTKRRYLIILIKQHYWYTGPVQYDKMSVAAECIPVKESLFFLLWNTQISIVRLQGDFARPSKKRFNWKDILMLFSGYVYRILIHFLSSASFLPSLVKLLHEIVFDFKLSSNLSSYPSFTMDWRSGLTLIIYKSIY